MKRPFFFIMPLSVCLHKLLVSSTLHEYNIYVLKLDRVASLMTDPQWTSFTTLSNFQQNLVFCDMTRDRWGKVNIPLKFQLPNSFGLGVKVF